MLSSPAVRLVVFDCDGTLMDSQHHIAAAMAAAFRGCGHACPSIETVRAVVGLSLVEAVAMLLPGHGVAEHRRVADHYREAFVALRQRPGYLEPLFPGIAPMIRQLVDSGCLLGVATGKGRRGLELTLGAHGLLSQFATLQTADRSPGKPDPAMLLQAMAEVGAAPAQTLLVGDTTFDMEMASRAGVRGIGVSWGYHAADALHAAGAWQVIDDPAMVPTLADMLTGEVTCD